MSFPTPHTLGWHFRNPDGPDRFRGAPTYTPPAGQAGTPVQVIGWAARAGSGARDGRQQVGHDRTEISVEVYAPPSWAPNVGDLVDLPSGPAGQFEVVGVDGFNHGFHGWQPGSVVHLQKIEG
ncbi:hypothetical protein IU487_22400 [Nocardia puris]|uniref:hypothetical protein n=1 Tax=Nocardia puris TaxID=208602 RepID=UPI001893C861|nr:hypothetical protein [Nocardia puris]MBF6213772.1 hypothetical protein [Nocardia puris]